MTNRADRRQAQAAAFDAIGERYDEAFPHKEGQLTAGAWLASQLTPGARVLDVGCGTGVPTARDLQAAGLTVTGIDISAGMLELAREGVPGAEFREGDVLDLDAALGTSVGTFDGAAAFFSLLMLPRAEIPAALEQLHASLRPGAPLALGMVEADLDDVPIPFLGNQVRVSGYPRETLRDVVETAGFDVLSLYDVTDEPTTPDRPPEVQLFLHCHRR